MNSLRDNLPDYLGTKSRDTGRKTYSYRVQKYVILDTKLFSRRGNIFSRRKNIFSRRDNSFSRRENKFKHSKNMFYS